MWLLLLIISSNAKLSWGHGNCDLNMTTWNCDDYHHYFSIRNVEETLKCIGYKKYIHPQHPLILDFDREIRQLLKIDENERLVIFEEKIALEFDDPRLKFNFCAQDTGIGKVEFLFDLTNLFWKPDLDTPPETLFKPNLERVLIKKNGRIKVSNLNLKSIVRCAMDYTWFPFDTQVCSHPVLIDEPTITINYDVHRVLKESLVEQFKNPDWNITLRPGRCDPVKSEGKQCFSVDLIFARKMSNHILHEYVPSLMLAFASTASLYIPADLLPARMSLSVTSCLSMITLFVNAKYEFTSLKLT